jgi:CMP-N,N'-diacetyllegionaminic acid synthase
MINGKTVLGIIPAREGSKGLAGKNMMLMCGKPLIAWSIEAALGSRYLDDVVVTTDSLEIANFSSQQGASVPFIRPSELASDSAATMDVVFHVLKHYENSLNLSFDYTVLLEPTSPQRDSGDIDSALEILNSSPTGTSIVGIAKTDKQNPAFLITLEVNGTLAWVKNMGDRNLRRQDTSDVYFLEGSIYASETTTLFARKSFYHSNTIGKIFPKWKSLEIDDFDDFVMVEALMAIKGHRI